MQVSAAIPVENYLSGETFMMWPVNDGFTPSVEHVGQVVTVCNQSQIYRVLFAKRLEGKPYTSADGEKFLAWARRGWHDRTHFVFLLLTPASQIAGAVDIKSADLESAEVGYWLNEQCSGVMTNALGELVRLAKVSGYRELFARVRVENTRSSGVLMRNGFAIASSFINDGTEYQRFTIQP